MLMFRDRKEAGIQLAEKLGAYKDREDVVVLALPRGGVVTGFEIARALKAPLDVIIVRKIGFPGQEELAIGAIAETGAVVLNRDIIEMGRIRSEVVQTATERQKQEISRRIALYRGGRGLTGVKSKIVLLVDDGVATGATLKAAIVALKLEKIARLVLAIPVGPKDTISKLETMADECICLETPPVFYAVGAFYRDFTQVSDEEVVNLLKSSAVKAA